MATIALTEDEQQLFKLLVDCLKQANRQTVLRVAGGWVRDKLLGKQSHDIDIATDDMSGEEFANLVNAYLASIGMETRSIAVIMVRSPLPQWA